MFNYLYWVLGRLQRLHSVHRSSLFWFLLDHQSFEQKKVMVMCVKKSHRGAAGELSLKEATLSVSITATGGTQMALRTWFVSPLVPSKLIR